MERISWTDRVKNEELLQIFKEERHVLPTVKCRKSKWIGHILRRKCLLRHVIEGKIVGELKVVGRRGRRRSTQLLHAICSEMFIVAVIYVDTPR
jgi:hypothetical protein